eukprot:9015810-Karenia_brevis.AAC.1
MVPHQLLAMAARKHRFSLRILRLSLAAYRLKRAIGIDGVFSVLLTATRGITAGSGFATSELRVLLVDLVRGIRTLWKVKVKLYVDDLTIDAAGGRLQAACRVAQATDYAIDFFEKRLKLKVSTQKSVAVASRPKVLREICAKSKAK